MPSPASCLTSARMSRMPAGSRPVAGSSSSKSWGLRSSDAAIPRRCRMPCEYPPTRSRARSRSSTTSSTSSMRLRASIAVEIGEQLEIAAAREIGIEARPSTNPATPSSARAPSWNGSRPKSSTLPSVGRISPRSIRSEVVFPAPFGPRYPKTSPRSTVRSTPATAVSSPYRLTSPRAATGGASLTEGSARRPLRRRTTPSLRGRTSPRHGSRSTPCRARSRARSR